jgi:hypothetical protein
MASRNRLNSTFLREAGTEKDGGIIDGEASFVVSQEKVFRDPLRPSAKTHVLKRATLANGIRDTIGTTLTRNPKTSQKIFRGLGERNNP